MQAVPYWYSPPSEPTRRFLKWLAVALLVFSTAFTVGYGMFSSQLGWLVVGGVFVLISLGLAVYAWRFAPADLGQRLPDPLVRSGQPDTTTA